MLSSAGEHACQLIQLVQVKSIYYLISMFIKFFKHITYTT